MRLIRRPSPRLPNPRPCWALILLLQTLFTIPVLFMSGCSGTLSSAKMESASFPPPPTDPSPPPSPNPPPANSPPSITTSPASETVTVGNSGIFFVTATGSAPFFYQWQKNGVVIPGATVVPYVTPPTHLTDDGSIFTVVVSNAAGSLMSAPAMLSVVQPSGSPQLTADSSNLSFGNVVVGSSSSAIITLTNSGSASTTIAGVSISAQSFSTSSALAGAVVAPGQAVTLGVVFTPATSTAFSGTITISSNAPNSPISIPVSGTGVAPSGHSATLSWNASTTSGVVGYLVERADQSGGPYTPMTATPIAVTTFTDSTVVAGNTYFYVVVAVDATGQLSAPSNEASVTIPTP
jgi:Abnormal spindle-like microcephaly-assoc'd, ASPM-SPD-2-Hydin